MLVRMKTQISGTRDGEYWPPKGALIDFTDVDEAQALIAAGVAEEVTADELDQAVAEDEALRVIDAVMATAGVTPGA